MTDANFDRDKISPAWPKFGSNSRGHSEPSREQLGKYAYLFSADVALFIGLEILPNGGVLGAALWALHSRGVIGGIH